MVGTVKLKGELIDGMNKPVAFATIVLRSLVNGQVISGVQAKTVTDSNGLYSFDVPIGSYDCLIYVDGVETAMPGIVNVYEFSGDGTLQDFLYAPCAVDLRPMFILQMELIRRQVIKAGDDVKEYAESSRALYELTLAASGSYDDKDKAQKAINDGVETRRYFYVKEQGNTFVSTYENVNGIATPTGQIVKSGNAFTDLAQLIGAGMYDQSTNRTGYFVEALGANAGKISARPALDVRLAIIRVTPGKTYDVYSPDWRADYMAMCLKEDKSMVGDTLGLIAAVGTGNSRKVTIPAASTAKYLMLNVKIPGGNFDIVQTMKFSVTEISDIDNIPVVDKWARENLVKNSITTGPGVVDIYDKNKETIGYFVRATGADAGKIQTNASTWISSFPVVAGQEYTIKASNYHTDYFAMAYKVDNVPTGETLGLVGFARVGDYAKFTVPEGSAAKFVFINVVIPNGKFDIRNGLKVVGLGQAAVKVSGYDLIDGGARKLIEEIKNKPEPAYSILKGKKIAWVGDSITAKNFRTVKNYHEYIGEAVGGFGGSYNYGISGSGFYNRQDVASKISESPDYITVFMGTNDFGNVGGTKMPLGNFLDTTNATVSGCINITLKAIIDKFFNKKIAVFTPLPRIENWGFDTRNNVQGYTLRQLADLIIKYCQHYSLPVLDLYSESSLPVYNNDGNVYYFTYPGGTQPDGLHPNDEGHKVIAVKIQKFLEGV